MTSGRSGLQDLLGAVCGDEPYAVVTPYPTAVGSEQGDVSLNVDVVAEALVHVDVEALLAQEPTELKQILSAVHGVADRTVVLFPPLGVRIPDSWVDSAEVAAKNLVSVLPDEVPVVTLLLARSVGRASRRTLMDEITATRSIAAVVEVPGSSVLTGVSTSVRAFLVRFDPLPPDRLVFLTSPRRTSPSGLAGEFRALAKGAARSEHGFTLDPPIDTSSGFLPHQLDPRRRERIDALSAIGETQPLGDLFEVFEERPVGAESPSDKPSKGAVPVLTGRLVRPGELAVVEAEEWVAEGDGRPLLAGDIAMRAVGAPGSTLVAAEVQESDLPLVAGRHVIVLRAQRELSPIQLRFLRHFLVSTRCADQIDSRLLGHFRVSPRELANVQVPTPNDDLLRAFEAVESAVSAFDGWRMEASELLTSVTEDDDLVAARLRLIEQSSLLRQRAEAALILDDVGQRVSTRYPLPVAYRWRSAVAARGGPESLTAALHAQEVLLAYLAIMTVVSAKAASIDLAPLRDIAKRLRAGRSGLGLGDWRAVLTAAAETRSFGDLPDTHPFIEVRGFLGDSEVAAACKRLTDLRNDVSHLREFGPGRRQEIEARAWDDLEAIFEAAEFVMDYRLIRVLATRWDALDAVNRIEYRHLAGDHAVVPRLSMETGSNEVETDGLYLVDRVDELHLLRPLMLGFECPECGHWSTFHPDRLMNDGSVEYKSLEHGHTTVQTGRVREHLAKVGLLEQEV